MQLRRPNGTVAHLCLPLAVHRGHFSLLALDLANKVNGVTKDPFGGSGKAADSVAAYVQQRLPGRIVPWQG